MKMKMEHTFWTSYSRCPEKNFRNCRGIGFTTYLDPKGAIMDMQKSVRGRTLAVLCHLELFHQVKKQIGKHHRLRQLKRDGYLFGRGVPG